MSHVHPIKVKWSHGLFLLLFYLNHMASKLINGLNKFL